MEQRVPKDHLQVWKLARITQDSAYSCLMAMIYYSNRIQRKISEGKRPTAESGGNQAQGSKSPVPVGAHRTCVITPATESKNTYVYQKARQTLNAQCFCWTLVMQPPSAQHIPKFQTSRKKAVFSINDIVCANNLATLNHPYQLGNDGKVPKFKFPDTSQGLILQAGLSKDSSLRPVILNQLCFFLGEGGGFFFIYFFAQIQKQSSAAPQRLAGWLIALSLNLPPCKESHIQDPSRIFSACHFTCHFCPQISHFITYLVE